MKTSIIIPIHNIDYYLCHYTGNCIGSIHEHTPGDYEIIVIDNASTVELTGLKWSDYVDKYIKNDKNIGVPAAWNQGIKEASGEVICLMNSDVQVYDNWLKTMLETLKKHDVVNTRPMYAFPFGRARDSKAIHKLQTQNKKYISDFKDGSCFVFKRSLIDKVGWFDENYGEGYGEDVDFQKRLEKYKKSMVCDERVAIHHIGMATGNAMMNANEVDMNMIMQRNSKYTEEKYNPSKTKAVVDKKKKKISKKGKFTVRAKGSGDKVYLIENGVRKWVKNPETLNKLGFKLGEEKMIDFKELMEYEDGGYVDLKKKKEIETVKLNYKTVNDPILGYKIEA